MALSLSFLDWIIFLIVMGGSLSFGLFMAYRKKAGQNSSNFFPQPLKLCIPLHILPSANFERVIRTFASNRPVGSSALLVSM